MSLDFNNAASFDANPRRSSGNGNKKNRSPVDPSGPHVGSKIEIERAVAVLRKRLAAVTFCPLRLAAPRLRGKKTFCGVLTKFWRQFFSLYSLGLGLRLI